MALTLEPALLAALSRLKLVTRRRADGVPAGNRIGRRRGHSLDFADHRAYADGDDLRFLDWQVLARHDQTFIRRYHEEQALPVRLLIDTSASMAQGGKFDMARRLAAGLAFVALAGGAVLSIHPVAARPRPPLGPLRGRARLRAVLDYLGELATSGVAALDPVARAVTVPGRAGLSVILSDFLYADGCERALAQLDHARHALFLVRVVAREEEEPEEGGDLSLVDAETGEVLGLTLTRSVLATYRGALAAHVAGLEDAARKRSAGLASVRADRPLAEILLKDLTAKGLLA